MAFFFILIISYLLGAIPSAWVVARLHGVDILSVGSRSAGFTNVWRNLGIKPALVVLLFDIGKGFVAAWVGFRLGGTVGMLLASFTAIFGHTLSCFIRFKGGKGVAVGAGVLLYISPLAFMLSFATLAGLALLTRYMSVGSIAAALLCPVYLLIGGAPALVVATFVVCGLYVVWMHRKNVMRLMNGTENRLNLGKMR